MWFGITHYVHINILHLGAIFNGLFLSFFCNSDFKKGVPKYEYWSFDDLLSELRTFICSAILIFFSQKGPASFSSWMDFVMEFRYLHLYLWYGRFLPDSIRFIRLFKIAKFLQWTYSLYNLWLSYDILKEIAIKNHINCTIIACFVM